MRKLTSIVFLMVCVSWMASARAQEESYFRISVEKLKTIAVPPPPPAAEAPGWRFNDLSPRVILDGPGQGFCVNPNGLERPWIHDQNLPDDAVVDIRVPAGGDVTGRLLLPKTDAAGVTVIPFKLAAADAAADGKKPFYTDLMTYDLALVSRGTPGGAWFRHEAQLAAERAGIKPNEQRTTPRFSPDQADDRLDESCQLFSGGRALSENLQLDRALMNAGAGGPAVDVNSLAGIKAPEMDWTKLIEGKNPPLDPLAGKIPFNQHAIFFPSFAALVKVADEADQFSLPVLLAAEPRSEDAGTRQHYERQLGLSLTAMGRLLGPKLIASVAITGSDPYLRVGSDVTVLVQPREGVAADVLRQALLAQIKLAAMQTPGAQPVEGEVAGLAFNGEQIPDRSLCSFVSIVGDAVALTNSRAQLQRLGEVQTNKATALASRPEYIFFRDRYKLGDNDEQALIVLSDATIRRWCSARWRIADSRRTRAAAVLYDSQADHAADIIAGVKTPRPLQTDLTGDLGDLSLTSQGATSSIYGSLAFMTPIAELSIDKVTKAEADTYSRWRDTYERNWRNYFDPIAIRLSAHGDQLGADLTVIPLILGTDYAQVQSISRGVTLAPDAGDPHDALAHLVLAINPKAPLLQQGANFAQNFAPGVNVDPLGWLGHSVALYADDDPFWAELANAKDPGNFTEANVSRIPIGLRIEVGNGLKLAAFLAAVHGYIDQSAPQMTVWQNLTYRNRTYVKVSPSEQAKGQNQDIGNVAIFYVADGDALLITPNEPLLERAIDRKLDGAPTTSPTAAATQPSFTPPPWLGGSLCLRAKAASLELIFRENQAEYQTAMQRLAWSNLPILNEWKRLFPSEEPLSVQERLFKVTLRDPSGGGYVWNEKWQTMESTVYGHPGEPKDGPNPPPTLAALKAVDFGLTFEDQGLRARAIVNRADAKSPKN